MGIKFVVLDVFVHKFNNFGIRPDIIRIFEFDPLYSVENGPRFSDLGFLSPVVTATPVAVIISLHHVLISLPFLGFKLLETLPCLFMANV